MKKSGLQPALIIIHSISNRFVNYVWLNQSLTIYHLNTNTFIYLQVVILTSKVTLPVIEVHSSAFKVIFIYSLKRKRREIKEFAQRYADVGGFHGFLDFGKGEVKEGGVSEDLEEAGGVAGIV